MITIEILALGAAMGGLANFVASLAAVAAVGWYRRRLGACPCCSTKKGS